MLHRILFLILSSIAVLVNVVESNPSLPFPLKPLDVFAPSYPSVKNPECRRHSQTFLKDLKDLQLWAVTMHDASGKISSGVLRGNVHWLGDATECYSVSSKPDAEENDLGNIRGQYCTARLFVESSSEARSRNNSLLQIYDLMHTHNAFRSSPEDGIVFFPSFNHLTLGLCIPRSCDYNDLEQALKEWISPLNSSSNVKIKLLVRPDSCTKEEHSKLNMRAILTLGLFLTMTLIAVAGALYEINKERREEKGEIVNKEGKLTRIFLAFSFRSNARALLDTDTQMDELGCLNGIRAIFAIFIYLLHKGLMGTYNSFSNREDISALMDGPLSMVMRSFWIFVDTFVIMSGLLTSYYAVKRLQEGRKLNILKMYLQRYIKFTPLFFVCVLLLMNVIEFVISDSFYTRFMQFYTTSCKESWLNVLTYTNTRRGFENMCYQSSHQLETDMQMYLLAPFFVLFLWKLRSFGVLCFIAMIALLSALKYNVVFTENLATVVYHGINLHQLIKSADFIYLNFIHRLVPYLFGVLLGYFLRVRSKNFKFSKLELLLGSAVALYGAHYSFYSMSSASVPGYVYNPYQAAIYGTLQPLLWSYSICWFIAICAIGQAEWINQKLRWKRFQVTSRLAYAFYLVQIPVMSMDLGWNPNPSIFSPLSIFDLNVFLITIGFTFWLTLLFLLPIGNLWKIFAEENKVDTKEAKEN